MKTILTNLGIFRARDPEPAKRIILLLCEMERLGRRALTHELPDIPTHAIRRALIDLQVAGILQASVYGEYRLAITAKKATSFTPVRMSKLEGIILTMLNDHTAITAQDLLRDYQLSHSVLRPPVKKLIARGLVEEISIANFNGSNRVQTVYTFKKPELSHATSED